MTIWIIFNILTPVSNSRISLTRTSLMQITRKDLTTAMMNKRKRMTKESVGRTLRKLTSAVIAARLSSRPDIYEVTSSLTTIQRNLRATLVGRNSWRSPTLTGTWSPTWMNAITSARFVRKALTPRRHSAITFVSFTLEKRTFTARSATKDFHLRFSWSRTPGEICWRLIDYRE